MSEKDENRKNATAKNRTATEAARSAALDAMILGILMSSPLAGFAFALIWGVQAGICAVWRKDCDADEMSC